MREAVARGRITMSRAAIAQIRAGAVKKGDPLQTARLAGIMAAKQTSALIPLCHPLALSHVDVTLAPLGDGYAIESRVRTTDRTGVEMEALTAVAVAALTIYDMLKAVDRTMIIGAIALAEKRGGRSGEYVAKPRRPRSRRR
jgi:cyclic pyranopterin phosphate synthase